MSVLRCSLIILRQNLLRFFQDHTVKAAIMSTLFASSESLRWFIISTKVVEDLGATASVVCAFAAGSACKFTLNEIESS